MNEVDVRRIVREELVVCEETKYQANREGLREWARELYATQGIRLYGTLYEDIYAEEDGL